MTPTTTPTDAERLRVRVARRDLVDQVLGDRRPSAIRAACSARPSVLEVAASTKIATVAGRGRIEVGASAPNPGYGLTVIASLHSGLAGSR